MSLLHRISVDLEAHIKPRVRMHYLEFRIACELKKTIYHGHFYDEVK